MGSVWGSALAFLSIIPMHNSLSLLFTANFNPHKSEIIGEKEGLLHSPPQHVVSLLEGSSASDSNVNFSFIDLIDDL